MFRLARLIKDMLFNTGSAMTSASHRRSAVQIYVAKAELIFFFDQAFTCLKKDLGHVVGTLELKSGVSHCVVNFNFAFPGSELIQGVLGMQCATEVPSSVVSNF